MSTCLSRLTILINHHRVVIASSRKRRRPRLLAAAGLALICGLWTVGLSQRTSKQHELGRLMGTVYNVPTDLAAGKLTVVIWNERRGVQDIPVDDKRRFKTTVPAGVYNVYIKGIRDDAAKALRHRIAAGDVTMVNLDWTPDQVYCTASGERVSPTGLGTFDASGLHRPKFESYNFDSPGREPINVVIEYCTKTPIRRDVAEYTSTRLMSGSTSIFAEKVSFDTKTATATATDTNVTFVQHDKWSTRFVAGTQHIGNFRNGAHLDMTGGSVAIEGKGSIARGKATFSFYISKDTLSFSYADSKGLVVTANSPDCSFIKSDSSNTAVFGGSAIVTGNRPGSKNNRLVEFSVKVVDNGPKSKNRDSFIIEIPELEGYERSGPLASGDIRIFAQRATVPPNSTSRVSSKP